MPVPRVRPLPTPLGWIHLEDIFYNTDLASTVDAVIVELDELERRCCQVPVLSTPSAEAVHAELDELDPVIEQLVRASHGSNRPADSAFSKAITAEVLALDLSRLKPETLGDPSGERAYDLELHRPQKPWEAEPPVNVVKLRNLFELPPSIVAVDADADLKRGMFAKPNAGVDADCRLVTRMHRVETLLWGLSEMTQGCSISKRMTTVEAVLWGECCNNDLAVPAGMEERMLTVEFVLWGGPEGFPLAYCFGRQPVYSVQVTHHTTV